MKRLIGTTLLSAYLGLNILAQDPVIMTVNNEQVTKSEFEQIFWKNKKENTTNKEELDEYLELFINFKLKVEAAEAAGLDTTSKFLNEFNGYKLQLQKPYLVDTTVNEALIKEAYFRTANELRASHIMISIPADANAEDTLAAYKTLADIKKQIESGKLTFDEAALKYSQDPSAKTNNGDLGYFTAFRMVYPFEDAAYKTEIGKISDPFRTQFGFHIVKPTDMRKSKGRMRVAHIMVVTKKTASEQDLENAEKKINELYDKLVGGEDFAALVRDYSDDRNSVRKNGEIEWVSAGKYYKEFEDAAFDLEKDEDFSKPVKTPAGWHIIKRIEYQPVDDFDALRTEIKNKIQRDPVRSAKTKTSFITKLKKEYAFTENAKNINIFIKELGKLKEVNKTTIAEVATKNGTLELFNYGGVSRTINDFSDYMIPRWKEQNGPEIVSFTENQYQNFITHELTEFEKGRLESKYPAYKALLREYRDGILLFEINDQKVWSYAIKDTAGLNKFYEANKNNYMWKDRVDARIFISKDKKVIKKAYKLVNKGELRSDSIVNYLNQDSQLNISFESGRFETENHDVLGKNSFGVGVNKPILLDDKYVLVAIDKEIPSQPKKLKENKGAITAAYQEYLEEQWLQELKKSYSVEVNKEVLYTIKNKP